MICLSHLPLIFSSVYTYIRIYEKNNYKSRGEKTIAFSLGKCKNGGIWSPKNLLSSKDCLGNDRWRINFDGWRGGIKPWTPRKGYKRYQWNPSKSIHLCVFEPRLLVMDGCIKRFHLGVLVNQGHGTWDMGPCEPPRNIGVKVNE